MEIKKIEHLAELSKLEFSEEEMISLSKDFDSMIELADMVKNADIKATSQILSVDMNDLRDDIVRDSTSPKDLLQNAPLSKKDSFVVPRIME